MKPARALPAISLILQMNVDETRTVVLTGSVTMNNMDSWILTDVTDSTFLGNIDNIQAHSFDYQAWTGGVAVLDYTVSGEGHTAAANMLVAINEGDNPKKNTSTVVNIVTVDTVNNTPVTIDLNNQVSDVGGDTLTIDQVFADSDRDTFGQPTEEQCNLLFG